MRNDSSSSSGNPTSSSPKSRDSPNSSGIPHSSAPPLRRRSSFSSGSGSRGGGPHRCISTESCRVSEIRFISARRRPISRGCAGARLGALVVSPLRRYLVTSACARAADTDVIRLGLALAPVPFLCVFKAVVPGAVLRRGSQAPRGGGIHATVVGRAACPHSRLHQVKEQDNAHYRNGQVVQRRQGLRLHHARGRSEGLLRPPFGDPGPGLQEPGRG